MDVVIGERKNNIKMCNKLPHRSFSTAGGEQRLDLTWARC